MSALTALRSDALLRWQRLGWPTTHAEAWRNFSTKPLQALDPAVAPLPSPTPAAVIARAQTWPTPRAVFVDGRFDPTLSDLTDLVAAGATLGALASDDLAAPRVNALVPADGALEALNAAYLTDGLALSIPPGVAAGVVHVVHLSFGAGTSHVRHLVHLSEGASLTLAHHHEGEDTSVSVGSGLAAAHADGLAPSPLARVANIVLELDLAAGASLHLGKTVAESARAAHLEAVHARLAAGATLHTFTLSLSGERVRTGITVTLAGPGASASVDGLYLGTGQARLDHVTAIRHAAPDTTSSETWAGVLDGRSEGGFQGLIQIDRDAVRASTRQLTRTLLLSDDALAHAKPELHIDCDDVAASHGASVGQLDPNERFYLASRGIPPELAQKMLVQAFIKKAQAVAPAALRDGPLGFDRAIAQALALDLGDDAALLADLAAPTDADAPKDDVHVA